MKLRYTLISILFLLCVCTTNAQVAGAPNGFSEGTEFALAYNYDLSKIDDGTYLYTIIPLLNNKHFTGAVTWTSSDPFAAEVNAEGVVTIIDTFAAFDPIIFECTITEPGYYNGLTAKVHADLAPNGGFTNLTGGQIVVNPNILERSEQPISFVLFPSGNRDNSTFQVTSLYTVSDETIATISDNKLIAHKEGVVTVTGTSSVDGSITASAEITVLFSPDIIAPTLDIQNYNGGTEIRYQRDSANTIPSATAVDDVDDTVNVVITETGTPFNPEQLGDYPVRYFTVDQANNERIIDVNVKIIDTIAPTLNLTDTTLNFQEYITANQGEGLTIPEVTAVDDNGDVITVTISNDGFNPDTIGVYAITYSAIDPSGNEATNKMNLEVKIGNPPVLTIVGYDDGDTITIPQNDESFVIPKAASVDALGNMVDVIITDTNFDIQTVGMYTITYDTTDRFGLTDQKTISVNVTDAEAPVISNIDEFAYKKIILENSFDWFSVGTFNVSDNTSSFLDLTWNIQEVNTLRTDVSQFDVDWYTDTWGGEIEVNGYVFLNIKRPNNEDFTHAHQHYFRIEVSDEAGNTTTTYMTLEHVDAQEPTILAREFEANDWSQIGYVDSGNPSNNTGNTLTYQLQKQDNFIVDESVLFIDSDVTPYVFERYELVGAGSADFYIDDANTENTSIKLANPLNASVTSQYNLQLIAYGRLTPSDPEVSIPINLIIDVFSPEDLAPEITGIQADLPADPVTGISVITLENLSAEHNVTMPSQSLLGEAYEVFQQDLIQLPIIQSGLDLVTVKNTLKVLPYAVWFQNEPNNITRIFVKFQKGAVSIQIEFIADGNNNSAYWIMNIGSSQRGAGIQPSSIHSSLAFLDHMEGNIVYTNTTVNKTNFEFISLVTNDNLTAGLHLVTKGNIAPGGYSPLLNPGVEARIGFTEAGWTVPDLSVKMTLSSSFFDSFDTVMFDHLIDISNAARGQIQAAAAVVKTAKDNVRSAEVIFEQAQVPVIAAQRELNRARWFVLNPAQRVLDGFIETKNNAVASRDVYLAKEICGPNVCLPYLYPKFCKAGFVYYPCGMATGYNCFEGCIPDPIALATAAGITIYIVTLEGFIATQQAVVNPILANIIVPLEYALVVVQTALGEAVIILDAAELALLVAEESLVLTEQGLGAMGEVARFLMDALPSLVETSEASFETTLATANSGTLSGTLGFKLKFKGSPALDRTASFNFSDPVGSATNIASSLVQ